MPWLHLFAKHKPPCVMPTWQVHFLAPSCHALWKPERETIQWESLQRKDVLFRTWFLSCLPQSPGFYQEALFLLVLFIKILRLCVKKGALSLKEKILKATYWLRYWLLGATSLIIIFKLKKNSWHYLMYIPRKRHKQNLKI